MILEERTNNTQEITWVNDGIDPIAVRSACINEILSQKIAEFRKDNNLTRAQMAEKIKTSQYMISQYEKPDYDFNISDFCRLSMIMNIEDCIYDAFKNIRR